MKEVKKSNKLENVLYDVRGPIMEAAHRLQEEGYLIRWLNTGNPAHFGFNAPEELLHDLIVNLPEAQGYCYSKGIFPARKAVMQYCQKIGIQDVDVEDIYIGNGVSELITLSLNALLNNGDEVLIPAPDYPLWTASVNLSGGTPVHYICDEKANWYPDIEDIKKKITPNTKGIVIINPNNPTGSVYPKELLQQIVKLAEEHEMIVFSDEIYDKILYDGAVHTPTASLSEDVLFLTYNGLSKSYRAAGFRAGWMIISGNTRNSGDYIEGINMLSNMRLCSNVPAQFVIQSSLGGYQSIYDLTKPGGRLYEQREYAYKKLIDIPGISCVKPQGALYLFPKVDVKKFKIKDDRKFLLDLLLETKICMVQGTGFNWPAPDHFRMVFLPRVDELDTVMRDLRDFLEHYQQV